MLKHKEDWPIRVMCRVMKVSSSAFYDWIHAPIKPFDAPEFHLDSAVKSTFKEHKMTLGSRRMVTELAKKNIVIGRFKARSTMRKLGLVARYPKKFKTTTDSNHSNRIEPNKLNRKFTVNESDRVWTTDITYIATHQGFIYLAVVMDLYSRRIVGWTIADNMRTELCSNALNMAYWQRKPTSGLLHHSDRGSQYTSDDYRKLLNTMKMNVSMSGKGECWDNAPTERFFRSLKHEQLNYETFKTKKATELSILDYLAYYNGKRPHSVNGYLSPIQYENKVAKKVSGFY
ncbi:IS3 family transposase [Psychromonas sp. KJ10-10]|uniref:IS3 family transposase n=1 Tax=Psychromonas sp. KJ10-10 TaxID=3391823 RepID=UPI0039B6C536